MLLDAVLAKVKTMPGEVLVVADPDGLVRSLAVSEALRAESKDVIEWDEPLAARLAFENPVSTGGRLVVVEQPHRTTTLPVDVLQLAQRHVVVEGAPLFAPLDATVVARLEWPERERAFELAGLLPGGSQLSAAETATQLLRRIYQLDPAGIQGPTQLLEALLRLHLRRGEAGMSAYLADVLAESVGNPIPGLRTVDGLLDRETFVAWLQASWDAIAAEAHSDGLREILLAAGPRQLLDDYFDGGHLRPAAAADASIDLPFGVVKDPDGDRARRVAAGLKAVAERLASPMTSEADWEALASEWADVLAAQFTGSTPTSEVGELRRSLNERFVDWLTDHYPELASMPRTSGPSMVHGASRFIERTARDKRVALVVVDGLSLGVWRALLPMLREPDWHVRETVTYAWIPTMTSISRLAIFAGKAPRFFGADIGHLYREQEFWTAWWAENAKLPAHEVGYVRGHLSQMARDGGFVPSAGFQEQLGRRVLGVVVEDVDHEVHHATLGEGVLYESLREWVRERHLPTLLEALLGAGYEVFITSDHGFVEVQSVGVAQSGVLADHHGRFERYTDETLFAQAVAKQSANGRRPWISYGLPDDYRVLFAPILGTLKPDRARQTTHGGPTIEEVIVPWVRIWR